MWYDLAPPRKRPTKTYNVDTWKGHFGKYVQWCRPLSNLEPSLILLFFLLYKLLLPTFGSFSFLTKSKSSLFFHTAIDLFSLRYSPLSRDSPSILLFPQSFLFLIVSYSAFSPAIPLPISVNALFNFAFSIHKFLFLLPAPLPIWSSC